MSLAHPWLLVASALAALALIWVYDRLRRNAADDALAYSNVPFFLDAVRPRAWITATLRMGLLVALGLLAIAISGPHLLFPALVHDGNVFICIDTSGSMDAADVEPTRAAAAKIAARAFITEAAAGTKIGIISFSSAAGVVQPLSADHETVAQALDDVPEPNGATAIGDALSLAARELPERGHRVIVLITDGVNNAGADPQEVAQWLGAHHIPVYTIGIGTNSGEIIPGTEEEATIDEGALRSYAQASGGAYARAENADELRSVLANLGRITSIERRPVDASLGTALLGAALLIAVFFAGFGAGRFA